MSLAASLEPLRAPATPEIAGDRASSRLEDVQQLVHRELKEVEAIVLEHVRAGVEPAVSSAHHLFESGGKRVRPLATLLSCMCFGPLEETARECAAAAELVHMATLLHDDVIDDGDERRGRVTSRRIWGNAVSVLAGDLLLVEALRLAGNADRQTWSEFIVTLRRLVDGEIIQLRGRLAVSLDEETYFSIVAGKTASLFEWSLAAGARAGGAPASAVEALRRFGGHLGVAFQLVDDLLDYAGVGTGKTMFADLAEGKVTLPLLVAARTDERITGMVAAIRGGDETAAERLARLVIDSGACDVVRARAIEETKLALACLADVPSCRAREVLGDVARGLASRVT